MDIVEKLRQRLITVPKPGAKPGAKPFKPTYPIINTAMYGTGHRAGDSAGYWSFNTTAGACAAGYNSDAWMLREMIYAVDPLCEEAAKEIESLRNLAGG